MLNCRYVLPFLLTVALAHAAQPTPKTQESFAPYWTAEPGWDTELQLRNNLAAGSLTVTPVLRLSDGKEIPLDPVTISSRAAASILLSEALLKRAPGLLNQPGSFGSVAFRYTALHARNLAAVAAVHMHAQPIGYHVDAFPLAHSGTAGSMEGIWWQPRPAVKDIVVISNSSAKAIGGVLTLSDASGKQWQGRWSLASHETQRMNVDDLVHKAGLTGNYGGITFASASFAPALDGVHFLYDETAGFSALMNMIDRDPAAKLEERTWAGNKQWTMWAPMLALQMPDPAAGFPAGTVLEPMIFLRNATAKKQSASITLTWRGDSGKGQVKLPELSLRPFETRALEIGPMQKQLGIPEDAHWALVTLTSPASPDDLLAIAASYDSTGRYGAQTPFSDNLGAYWSGGQWQVDATHNAIIAVTNGGNRATDALLTLHFEDGKKNYEIQQTIQPGEQMWLNLADLIHHSAPDRKGNALPADVTSGTYDLEDLNPGLGGNLIEGKVVLDKTWGHLTYGCLTCCGYTPYLSPNPVNVIVSGTGDISTLGTNNCTAQNGFSLNSYFNSTGKWWSDNTGIATVTAYQAQGVSPGTANGYASATILSGDGGRPKNPCPQLLQQASAPVPVAPSISPAQGLIGTTVSNVTISGSGFGSSPTVTAGTGITITVNSKSGTSITASFAIASTAPGGNIPITVTTTSGTTLPAVNFYVQVPTHFQRYDQPPEAPGGLGPVISLANGTAYDLSGKAVAVNVCGVYENFVFDIADQQGTQITNGTVKVTEVFSNITNPPGPTPATNVSINLVSQGVQDIQIYGFTYPTCPANNQNQALDMTWTVLIGSTVYPVTTVVHITKGNFNGTLNVTSSITTP